MYRLAVHDSCEANREELDIVEAVGPVELSYSVYASREGSRSSTGRDAGECELEGDALAYSCTVGYTRRRPGLNRPSTVLVSDVLDSFCERAEATVNDAPSLAAQPEVRLTLHRRCH